MGHNGPTFAIDWHHEERNWVASAGRDKMIKVASRFSVDYWAYLFKMYIAILDKSLFIGLHKTELSQEGGWGEIRSLESH